MQNQSLNPDPIAKVDTKWTQNYWRISAIARVFYKKVVACRSGFKRNNNINNSNLAGRSRIKNHHFSRSRKKY
jgi:hypothetical protein